MPTILITGGAGFIGSHLADALIARGDRVRALDSLDAQVHGDGEPPTYLHPDVELLVGDVRDESAVERALRGVDAVVHLAATVGVGQSMYQIGRYVGVNDQGTATLLQALERRPVRKLVVASSMSVYGEGMYRGVLGEDVVVGPRSLAQLRSNDWEVRGRDGQPLEPVATPETKVPSLESVYALTKYSQERLCLIVGRAYGIPTIALRFFNVYGARQSLSNPYTGVLAIFASRLLNQRAPMIYEDGRQRRDFVAVEDVVHACCLALDSESVTCDVFNVGSGASITIRDLAAILARELGTDIAPEVTGQYRFGDIRLCFADIGRARDVLGYQPRVSLSAGLSSLVDWLGGQVPVDRFTEGTAELSSRGLTL